MKKNVDFVAIDPELKCSWKYVIPARSEYISGVVKEMLSISSHIYRFVDGFALPLHVTYAIGSSNANYRTDSVFDSAVTTSLDVSRESIRGDTGVSYDAFAQSINEYQSNNENTKVLTLVHMDEMGTKIHLKDSDHYISRSSRQAKVWRNKVIQGDPTDDPLFIELRFNRPRGEFSGACFLLTIGTATDIWFEDTELGRINRNGLSLLLRGLYENLEVLDVEVDSNRFDDDELRSLVFPRADEDSQLE